jgi:hypothetical protein
MKTVFSLLIAAIGSAAARPSYVVVDMQCAPSIYDGCNERAVDMIKKIGVRCAGADLQQNGYSIHIQPDREQVYHNPRNQCLRSYTSLAACGWGAVAALVFCLVGTCGRAVRELTSFATPPEQADQFEIS